MSNFVFYDFETSSSNKYWGQIIQIGAVLTNDKLQELDRFEARCKLNSGIIPEAMALIVNQTTPKMLQSANLSHYQMIRQFVETLKRWGRATFIGFNSIDFDEEYLRNTLFQTLEYPYLTSTNGNTRGDLLSLARAANFYYPDTLKNSINAKGNAVYKLDQMAPINGIKHNAHQALGDCIATLEIGKIILNKAPNVWRASLMTTDKTKALELIKNELYFCTDEYYYGKSVAFCETFVCEHPVYKWPKCFDLKNDPDIYLKMNVQDLKEAMGKKPKFIRTIRHNKHPVIMNPSYAMNLDEYKILGPEKLRDRANKIKSNKEFSEKVAIVLREEVEEKEQTKSQEDIPVEESIYKKFTPSEDNNLMNDFHKIEWENKFSALNKFKDDRLKYFGEKLIYREKPELLPKELYNEIQKDFAAKLLSKNSEKWNTIPKTYAEIDTLRVKFEKLGNKENLLFLEDINAYVEDLEKNYTSV